MSRRVQYPHVPSLALPLPLSFVVILAYTSTLPTSTPRYAHLTCADTDGTLIPKQVGVKA